MATVTIQREEKKEKKSCLCDHASITVVKKLGGAFMQMFWYVVMLPPFCLVSDEEETDFVQ